MHRRQILACSVALACLAMVGCTISSTPGTQTPVSLSIAPTNASLPLGLVQPFTATAQLHGGGTQDVTTQAQWTSSNTSVATIDAKGNLKTLTQGTTTVTAVYGTVNASTGVTVTPPGVIAVNISPPNPNPIQVGQTQQFTATGTMSDGSKPPDITNKVTWASSNASVASIVPGGLATANAVGVTLISATYGSGQNAPVGFVTLIVNPALTSISVTPSTATIAESTNQQFTAIGLYNDGSTQDITTQAGTTWTINCGSSGAATVSAGLVKAAAKTGSCTVTAASGTVPNGTATLTVSNPSFSTLAITPAVPNLPIGVPIQFHATGQFAGGLVQDLTATANTSWTSSQTAVAGNPNGGKTTTHSQGTTNIVAQFGSAPAAQTALTVTGATLSSIAVTSALTTLGEGTQVQLTAKGTYSDKSVLDLTSAVTWKSSTSAISVSPSGLATANLPGSATVTASLSGITSAAVTFQVNPIVISSLAITPVGGNGTIAVGTTQQFKATATFSNKSQQDITGLVQWNSSDPTAATVRDFGSSAGLATGLAAGTATISAVFGSLNATTSSVLTVTSAAPGSLTITPSTSTLTLGTSQQLKAVVTFNGISQDVTSLVTWSSSNINVVVVNESGLAVTSGKGSASVSATFTSSLGTATNSTSITVQ